MAKGKHKEKKGTKTIVLEKEIEDEDDSPMELSKGNAETIDLGTRASSSRSQRRVMDNIEGETYLKKEEKPKSLSVWENFDDKHFRNAVVPLDYIVPMEKDWKKVAMVQGNNLSPELSTDDLQ
ncbi:OLC1v1016712C1 [Oldenlandia corymbosa var. corymbosa]|uniref:OLC1v1016712C1 n=1 Tax=Oldenlandia corymbosa var. corymbosa TaxID=529605 RepID=A0AAV1E7R5_OLDCO|nr:OLC1v1016712C1 [Oldenlandia corymbosa var. corymbosa]